MYMRAFVQCAIVVAGTWCISRYMCVLQRVVRELRGASAAQKQRCIGTLCA